MKRTQLTAIGLLISLFVSFTQASASFIDVPNNNPYGSSIQFLEDLGIVSGTSFAPEQVMTRGEFATWLLKISGFNNATYKSKKHKLFIDVPARDPAAPAIYKLFDIGALTLDKKKPQLFQPERKILVHEALEWTIYVLGIPVPKVFDEGSFAATDLKVSSALAPMISKAIELGMVSAGKVHAYSALRRDVAARILDRARNATPTLIISTVAPGSGDNAIGQEAKFDILSEVWNRVLATYLHRSNLNKDQLMYAAAEGLVKELGDAHSDFERPGNSAIVDSLSGEVEGIGAVIQKDGENIVIVSPIRGSPAEKAGLQANDIILSVDGVSTKDQSLTDTVARIKGKKGTSVTLSIKRGARTLEVHIVRDKVKIASVTLDWTNDHIAVLTITNFGDSTGSEFHTAAKAILAEPKARGIIIDLRNNPGGYLDTAIDIAGSFVQNGKKVVSVRYPDHEDSQFSVGDAALAPYKIVVLVNKGSASASEILAGALQDFGLAKIIGDKSYGKGTVQELSGFTDGSTLRLTVAEWLTPNGRSIEKNGVTPDIIVPITDADRTAKKDPQMDRALVELR